MRLQILYVMAGLAAYPQTALTPAESALLRGVTANSMKGHVSFLASDALEGRDTPSRGLDVAAEYIASRFRAIGLEPAGDDGYFQTAAFGRVSVPMEGFDLEAEGVHAAKEKVSVAALAAAELRNAGTFRYDPLHPTEAAGPATRGKVALLLMPPLAEIKQDDRMTFFRAAMLFGATLKRLEAAAGIIGGFPGSHGDGPRVRALDPEPPVILVSDAATTKALTSATSVTLTIPAPVIERAPLRNVVGVIRGTDPKLKSTFVLVSAHYDHVGMNPQAKGDKISNGANDDASGVASVLALAEAFAQGSAAPRRTLVFVTYFGEEKGMLGSRYYAEHPVFPLARTVANFNLEQTGRTDDSEGTQLKRFAITGFDYSTLGEVTARAAKRAGVTAFRHAQNSDNYFGASDNQPLADAGVPAHTLSVAYDFPGYHQPGDEWPRIDYANMEAVTRAFALAVSAVANSAQPPQWNATADKTAPYRKAAAALAR